MTQYSPPTTSPTTARARWRWRVVDIIVAAVLGVAIGLVFVAWNYLGGTGRHFLGAIFPPLKGLLSGVWLLGGVLGGLVIRKPGAAIFVEMIAALVPALIGNQWGITTLLSGLLQGLGAEVIFLIFFYRVWKLPIAMLAGALAAAAEWVYEIIAWYADTTTTFKGLYLVAMMISGALLAGILGWLAQRGLARTGALDRFASGREVRRH